MTRGVIDRQSPERVSGPGCVPAIGRRAAARLAIFAALLVGVAPLAAQETITFPTPDGGTIHADVYGSGTHGVVLAHGGRLDRSSWREQAVDLADAGFRVLALDFRGYGESGGGTAAPRSDEAILLDVLAAVRYLREMGAEAVSVVGASLGGWAAAEAAATDPGSIDRLVLLAHPAIEAPERMQGRKLFVVTRDDPGPDGSPRLSRIREQYERATGPKELVILDGSAHAQFVFETEQGERLMREILRFLTAP